MPIFYIFILLLTSFLWGGNFVIGKFLVGHASPITLTSLRWMIALLCLVPMVWMKEKRILPPSTAVVPLLLMGLSGVVLFNIFQYKALEQTSATNVGLISTLNPISIAMMSSIFLHEKTKPLQVLSMILSLLGVVFVVSKGEWERVLSMHFNIGDIWMIMAVLIWGIYTVCGKWAMKKVSPMMSTLYSGVFGIIMLLPFNVKDFTITNFNSSFFWSLLYTGIISTVVCMVLWNIGVQKIGAATAGTFLNFNPIFTAILAFLILGEDITLVQVTGSIIIMAGCYLFSLFKEKDIHVRFNHRVKQKKKIS